MRIDDYRHANCSLFRVPPLNIALLSETISRELVEAWRRGDSVDITLNTLLYDSKILKPLITQIEDPLKFQKDLKIKEIEGKKQEILKETKESYKVEINQVELECQQKLLENQQQLSELEKQLEVKRQDCNAANTSLEEMRRRVQEKLNAMGGKKTLDKLLQINRLVTNSSLESQSKMPLSPEENLLQPEYIILPASKQYLDSETDSKKEQPDYDSKRSSLPLSEPDQLKSHSYEYIDKRTEKKYSTKAKESILKKVWKILNYKLW